MILPPGGGGDCPDRESIGSGSRRRRPTVAEADEQQHKQQRQHQRCSKLILFALLSGQACEVVSGFAQGGPSQSSALVSLGRGFAPQRGGLGRASMVNGAFGKASTRRSSSRQALDETPPRRKRPFEKRKKAEKVKVKPESACHLARLLESGEAGLNDVDVCGESYKVLQCRSDLHPVMELLKARRKAGTSPGAHGDGMKLGLAIEGGGMRGCISAGMIASIASLGLMDSFDSVYGSSAGSLVGAYAIAAQPGMPRIGCSVYYDKLTGPGRHFIDTRYLLRSLGLGLLGFPLTRWTGLKEIVGSTFGSPVLKLDYLLEQVVEDMRPLDWDLFWERQAKQPLHVIASGVESQSSVCLSAKGGHFNSLRELTACMRASMLLPGITGPLVKLPSLDEPLCDSQLFEPIPYRTAIADGCTHVLVVRSRPDGRNCISKISLSEKLLLRRFFKRKHKLPALYKYMKSGGQKVMYGKDLLTLNVGAAQKAGDDSLGGEADSPRAYVMPLSLQEGEAEIGRLERTREGIFGGVRKGFEHAHELLKAAAPDLAIAGLDGPSAAKEVFPDSILEEEEDPLVLKVMAGDGR